MNTGGDKDYELITVPRTNRQAVRSGNGAALTSSDGNTVGDSYLQFRLDDDFLYDGTPTTRVLFIIEYLDVGDDQFNIQYDALSGGVNNTGQFKDSAPVFKENTGQVKTVELSVCDARFANRDQDADFRIADRGDGAETILSVTVRKLAKQTGPIEISVDSCGANPFDEQPDSDAIQACINQSCSGDTITFTSPDGESDYPGYIIDKTIMLVHPQAKHDLTFTSTDPDNHALLIASADLKGFVAALYARSVMSDTGLIDDIVVRDLDFDGNRAERVCNGADQVASGVDDNWGSWLPECSGFDDPWCSPGTLAMRGYFSEDSSYGIVVQNVTISNTECGTALAFQSIEGMIDSVTIDTAGDHVHGPGCALVDDDEPSGAWSDGITFAALDSVLSNITVINASDIGIVCFACSGTQIINNTIMATEGNHGMFGGIALHPWGNSDFSGIVVSGNQIINEADENCGGIHAGIDIGLHMWGAGCNLNPGAFSIGNVGACTANPQPPGEAYCDPSQPCQLWGYLPPDSTFTLTDNFVSGAQVNYLIGGVQFEGIFVQSGNISETPRWTDWQDDANCDRYGVHDSWGLIEFAAFDPILPGWVPQRIHCER